MINIFRVVSISILLFASIAQCTLRVEKVSEIEGTTILKKDSLKLANQTDSHKAPQLKRHKYSSKIAGSRFSTDNVFGIRILPVNKNNLVNETTLIINKITSTTENVLDFRISNTKKGKEKVKEKDDKNKKKDMVTASAGGGKLKKEADDDEEKTLAQQVADGKYGLIQNEIFANGSKRPGILSYASNTEVPKDTKENLGGLEKDEIWLAEDHILVLRGGNYQNIKENKTPSSQVWPPIDDYKAPDRQVKIPKNPEIPPPFPVQLTENGPVEFIKGQKGPPAIPPIIPSFPPFNQETNKTIPFPYPSPNTPPPRGSGNKTFPFPVPPHLLPPFLSNLPPGATFVAPPVNQTDIDEDDPSIYYPPRYDFYYPQDNTTAVPPGPLVPGIILPPPPDFFAVLENDTDSSFEQYNDTDYSINSVTSNSYSGPKYLPANRKPTRPRIQSNRYPKRPTVSNLPDKNAPESVSKTGKPAVAYIFPENSKQKLLTTTTPPQNFFRTSIKVPANKHLNGFSTPIFVPSNLNQSIYHPLPTTSPKPNHITLPTTKTLPKQIYIITTPETVDKNRIENIYEKSKPVDIQKYEHINPEIHPLRSLIKPNVTITYNGKYGRLPPATVFPITKEEYDDAKPVRNYYVTPSPPVKTSKAPSTDINSITVTPVPVIKKIRVHPIPVEKPEVVISPSNSSKATFYFYEEPSTTERPTSVQQPEMPHPRPSQIGTNPPVKNEMKPVTQFYYTTKSTTKTPIRQYLEETFHSSNVLPQKPLIGLINNAEIIPQNSYSEIQKMKHLNYGTHVSPKPAIKYHYVKEDNAVIIPSPKIKDLEIKNSGSIGLQNVNLDKAVVRPVPKPIVVQDATEATPKQETQKPLTPNYEETPKPPPVYNNDGPFIPSNYYATVRPELIHFTSQEQTLVDDITKNYFTIFGQKINSVSTTPLTPIKSTKEKNKSKPESGLTYISDTGQNFKIQQVHENSGRKPGKSRTAFYTSEKPKASTTTLSGPPSNFEKYLKELTGEDQKDYIVTGVFPTKVKKGKGFFEQGPAVGALPPRLLSKGPTVFINGQPQIHQVGPVKTHDPVADKPMVPYQSSFSTTLRPVDVEIKPQYIQHIPPPQKPLGVYPQILPQNIGLSQNFQQYIQEITGLTSPTTTRPVRVKNPNLEYFPTTASPIKPLSFHHPPFQVPPEVKPKPVSLEGDILVNFKRPRPVINPEAELININGPGLPFDVSPNIKIVDSPDLSKNPNQPYSTKQITFGVAQDIFQNHPKSGYFSPPHQTGGNAFVSYNLPGNGGHFYFLTPQIVQKEKEDKRNQETGYKRINRSEDRNNRYSRNGEPGGYSTKSKHNLEEGFSNHDYLRRSRKKP